MLVQEAVTAIERKDELKLNELQAVHVIMTYWHAVSSATISNCFRKEGSVLPVRSTLKRRLKVELERKTNNFTSNSRIEVTGFVNYDGSILTAARLCTDEICNAIEKEMKSMLMMKRKCQFLH
jgi:hypothetical protein